MKKYLACILVITILLSLLSGCGASNNKPSSADAEFVKPEKYAAVVNVSVNPSFDIYLDDDAKVLAVEPKNEDAQKIDFSSVIGFELSDAMKTLMKIMFEKGMAKDNSVLIAKIVEGEENVKNIDIIEIVENAGKQTIAKETVNASMDSALMCHLQNEIGCGCLECLNEYEETYCYGKWEYKHDFERYMTNWEGTLEELKNKDTELYNRSVESFESMTLEKYIEDIVPTIYRIRQEYGAHGTPPTHKEIEITYKILEQAHSPFEKWKTEEYSAEEYFKKYPEDIDEMEGLEKAIHLLFEVYINGERSQTSYWSCWLYLCNGKWYTSTGLGNPGA